MPAGEQKSDGSYPKGTINHLVDKRLREILEQMKKFTGGAAKKEGGKKKSPAAKKPQKKGA
jgi:hypothetical protein